MLEVLLLWMFQDSYRRVRMMPLNLPRDRPKTGNEPTRQGKEVGGGGEIFLDILSVYHFSLKCIQLNNGAVATGRATRQSVTHTPTSRTNQQPSARLGVPGEELPWMGLVSFCVYVDWLQQHFLGAWCNDTRIIHFCLQKDRIDINNFTL